MRKTVRHPWFFAAALAAFCPAVFAAAPAYLPDTRARANDEQLRHALEEIRDRHHVPGLAAAVFDRGNVRAFGVGELAPDGNPVTPDSRFRVGQVSLLFTGITAAALIADGSLPADGELRGLAPEVDLHNPWSGERPVRIADLVSHRAGLGATRFRDVYTDAPAQPLLAGINSAFRALRVERRPGEQERYSVVGHAIAAYLVEKAAGMPYEDELDRMLFQPLEAGAATLGRPAGPLSGDSAGHAGWPARPVPAIPLNLPTAGDLWISAKDLARVGRLLLNRGRWGERDVLPAAAVDWLEAPPADDAVLVPGSRRGVDAEEFDGVLFYTQTGALPGFLARFAYSPALERGYLVLLNHGDARHALAAADALLRGQILSGATRAPAVPSAAPGEQSLESLAGWYRNTIPELAPGSLYQSWMAFARASLCGNRLCLSHATRTWRLEVFDETRLRDEGSWQPGWEVRETENGLLLESRDARWQRVSPWEVVGSLAAAAFVLGGLLLGICLLPLWAWSLARGSWSYHALVPRALPLAAVITVVAMQVLLFTTDYPALGRLSAPTVAILVASILAPLLALSAIPAAIAGFVWRMPLREAVMALYAALAAGGAALAMAMHDLVAFQTWNY
ncbi:MAG TPA: serine hydrolase domain-containing protein [Gammaproteobacteria bacterium]